MPSGLSGECRSIRPHSENFVDLIIGCLEYVFYVGVISLVVGVLLWSLQFLCVRILRVASPERVWTLRIWPALLLSLGIICLTLPAAVRHFAPPDLLVSRTQPSCKWPMRT